MTDDRDDRRVIVIGSGPSGAMASHELVRLGIPVVLLESGDATPDGRLVRVGGRNLHRQGPTKGFEDGKTHTATGDPETQWHHNLAPGGLSNQWTGAVPRFAPEDFTEGERLHEKYRWPLTYAELAPYYERAERLMNVTAPPGDVPNLPAGFADHRHCLPQDWQQVAEYAARRGQGLTTLPLADGPPNLVVRRGTAFNSYTNIAQPLLGSPHFKLITGAHALRLEYDALRRQVSHVVYEDRGGSQHRLRCAAVIVCAGALNSAKLLLASACPDFPEGLGNADGVLGRYLHDHPKEWWAVDFDKPLSRLVPAGYLTRKPHPASPPLLATSWTISVTSTRDKILSFTPLKGHSVGVQVFGTTVPSEAHYVEMDADHKDRWGLPLLRIHISYDEAVVANMTGARQHFLDLMEEAGYKGTLHEIVPQLFPGVSVHYGGTVRMHESPRYGMLDGWNRLHHVPNVLVGDASAFTTGPEKNPTLTAMALSARAAEQLTRDLKAR